MRDGVSDLGRKVAINADDTQLEVVINADDNQLMSLGQVTISFNYHTKDILTCTSFN